MAQPYPILTNGYSPAISVSLRIPLALIEVTLLPEHGPPLKLAGWVVDVVLGSLWDSKLLYKVDCFESVSTGRISEVHGYLVVCFGKNVFISSTRVTSELLLLFMMFFHLG